MKRILTMVLPVLFFIPAAFAQKDLSSWAVFHGDIVPGKQMVKTEVRGGGLKPYGLNYYLGVSFTADEAVVRAVGERVLADAGPALSSETETVGERLTYALVQVPPSGKANRYLCYQAREVGSGWKITLLYLEGPATPESLRSMFNKQ